LNLEKITNPTSNLTISEFLFETFYSSAGEFVEDSTNLDVSVVYV
jgi:hypothetical protein